MRLHLPVGFLVPVLAVVACTGGPNPSAPTSGSVPSAAAAPSAAAPAPSATDVPVAVGAQPPPGDPVRIDTAVLGAGGSTLTVTFIGGKVFDPTDPCSNHYFGWAHEADGVLQVKVVDDTPKAPGPGVACDAVGHRRTITIDLERPFAGSRVKDLAGYVHFVRRPDGLAELTTLPPGWTLKLERDVEESPTGRWQRTWTRAGAPDPQTSKGKIDLYQAFGGPADVTGGDEISHVLVNGNDATLYRFAPDGELVLVWRLGTDTLALVVNETDFPQAQAIKLAEGAAIP